MVLNFYKKVLQQLEAGEKLVLMVVIKSTGSSPGRQGFLQMVTANMQYGSIGGGIMEHKWITVVRELLDKGPFLPFAKLQVHRPGEGENRSGMICSGEQVIAFYYLDTNNLDTLKSIVCVETNLVCYDEKGISIAGHHRLPGVYFKNEFEWAFIQTTLALNKAFIFGAGHVGLALSRLLFNLDFETHLFDNRTGLAGFELNPYAHFKQVIEYEQSSQHIPEGEYNYVIIMSVGYRTDEVILRSLLGRSFRYLGMLGSREKVMTLKARFLEDGVDEFWLQKLHAPLGLDIKSETPEEIAISIAAELVGVKNGRVS